MSLQGYFNFAEIALEVDKHLHIDFLFQGQHSKKPSYFECTLCKRRVSERRMLESHMETVHKKKKPFLCSYCGKSFASKSTLNLHIRIHTGKFLYVISLKVSGLSTIRVPICKFFLFYILFYLLSSLSSL